MATSPEELAGLRAHAQQLQIEWRSIRAAAPESRADAEREVEAEALRREIIHLQGVLVQETKSAGGSTDDALAAMRRAAEAEDNVSGAYLKKPLDDEDVVEVPDEDPGHVSTSSARNVGPALPGNPPNEPVDSGVPSNETTKLDLPDLTAEDPNDTDEEGSR